MNLALSDEQEFLREAARGALSRFKTLEAAREALDGEESALPDLWPTAVQAGWPGLLIDEAHGGAGLDAFDAMLVMGECGRVLAGDQPARSPSRERDPQRRRRRRADARRARQRRAPGRLPAGQPARRPARRSGRWTPAMASSADPRPRPASRTARLLVSGELAFVPDAPGADLLVGVALRDGRAGGRGHRGRRRGGHDRPRWSATTRPARWPTSASPTHRRRRSTSARSRSRRPGTCRRRCSRPSRWAASKPRST